MPVCDAEIVLRLGEGKRGGAVGDMARGVVVRGRVGREAEDIGPVGSFLGTGGRWCLWLWGGGGNHDKGACCDCESDDEDCADREKFGARKASRKRQKVSPY